MPKKKLTTKQRNEIIRRYIDNWEKAGDLAEEYGVCKRTIYDVINSPEKLEAVKARKDALRADAEMKVAQAGEKAVERLADILNTEYPPGLQYLWLNSAQQVLDRMGVRKEKEEKTDVTVRFEGGGFEVGMPEGEEEEREEE